MYAERDGELCDEGQARLIYGCVESLFALRCAGLDLDAANGVESHPLQERQRMGHNAVC